jgi:hypothetical protein
MAGACVGWPGFWLMFQASYLGSLIELREQQQQVFVWSAVSTWAKNACLLAEHRLPRSCLGAGHTWSVCEAKAAATCPTWYVNHPNLVIEILYDSTLQEYTWCVPLFLRLQEKKDIVQMWNELKLDTQIWTDALFRSDIVPNWLVY